MSRNTPIPQELLSEISSFGQIHPDLTAEYVYNEVNAIDPEFPWHSELKILQLRRDDQVYQSLHKLFNVLESFGKLDESHLILWDDTTNKPMNEEMYQSLNPTYLFLFHHEWETVVDDGCQYGVTNGLLIEDTDNKELIAKCSEIGFNAIEHKGNVAIPLGLSLTREKLSRAIYLMNPRTDLSYKSELMMSLDYASNSYSDYDVSYPLEITAPSDRDPTDIVADILELDPQYDLGSLLAWSKIRRDVIRTIQNSELYRICKKGVACFFSHLNSSIDSCVTINFLNEEACELMKQYLITLGIDPMEGESNEYPEIEINCCLDDEGKKILHKMIWEFIFIRLAITRYVLVIY